MENSNKPKNLFLKFLPRAASAVSFQNPQYSPGRDHHHHHHHSSKLKAHAHKGFSGPINYSVLRDEARGKPKKDGSYEPNNEPTSPKVSCMGQIKYKHKKKKLQKLAKKNSTNNDAFLSNNNKIVITNTEEVNKKSSTSSSSSSSSSISKFFTRSQKKSKGYTSEEHGKNGRVAALDQQQQQRHKKVPSLGQMNKFASGRESLANFDWTAQIAPLDHDRDYYSDDEERRRDHSSDDDDGGGDDDGEEVIIPYSAPMLLGGRSRGGSHDDHDVMGSRLSSLEPKKEVNLWKRRTMAPPPPLALNSKVSS